MGFGLGRTYVMEFEEGTYLAGAEIRVRSASIGTVEQLESLQFADALPLFLDHVESWNLEVDGRPLPIEIEAVRNAMEAPVRDKLIREWYKAAVGVSAPLDPPLPAGDSSRTTDDEVPSMPMETLSALPESTNGPFGS